MTVTYTGHFLAADAWAVSTQIQLMLTYGIRGNGTHSINNVNERKQVYMHTQI